MESSPYSVLVVGARKFVLPNEVQSSSQIRWWGAVKEPRDVIPPRLCCVFSKSGLARGKEVKTLASSQGARFLEFKDESEILSPLSEILVPEPQTKKEGTRENGQERTPRIPAKDLVLKGDRVINVPIDRIRRFEGQPRKYFNKERLIALSRSIYREKQRVPVILIPIKDDPLHDYQIYDGERRWRAAKMINQPTLLAIVAESMDDAELFKSSAICNFGREDHQFLEIALALRKIKEQGNYTVHELADSFARSSSWVVQHLSLLKLHGEVQKMADPDLPDEKKINFSAALEIVKLPLEYQLEAARHILVNNYNLSQIRHYIRKKTERFGTASSYRKRKPSDDYRTFRRFLEKASEDVEMFLDLPRMGKVGKIFKTRPYADAEKCVADVDWIISKLREIRDSISEEAQVI